MPVVRIFYHGTYDDLKASLCQLLPEEDFNQKWTSSSFGMGIILNGFNIYFKDSRHQLAFSFGSSKIAAARGLDRIETQQRLIV